MDKKTFNDLEKPQELKLHLGCGDKHLDGFVNIDIRYHAAVDRVDDVRFLKEYAPNSVDLIYACHVLEHFTRWEHHPVLVRWHQILKPGGTLRLSVPDFGAIVKRYEEEGNIDEIGGLLYGGQTYDQNFHHWTWDLKSMSTELRSIGFADVRRYDWRETEHAHVDDYSQAYIPHMDKTHGKLMSLNVEARK